MALMRNFRSAVQSLRFSKWRSLMTMTGVILGVVSVVTIVSIGEGVKRQVVGQVNQLGSDLITVRPGSLVTRDKHGNIVKVNQISNFALGSGSLSESDLTTIKSATPDSTVVPVGVVNSGAKLGEVEYNEGIVFGTSQDFPTVLKQKVSFGTFFSDNDSSGQIVVIGKKVAENLFRENVPIGRTISIRGKEFVVVGVFDDFTSSPLAFGVDLNKAIVMPYQSAQDLVGHSQLVEVFVRPKTAAQTDSTISNINQQLSTSHGGQNDFTVLRQDENLTVVSDILRVFTTFISAVAAMSLLIGGIGILNIMLVSVTERTREIGIRKAIGATNRQIAGQFFMEALVLSGVGGALGIIASFMLNALLRILTHLTPVITLNAVLLATTISVAIGVIFGVIPAVRAASKDPIDALRYE